MTLLSQCSNEQDLILQRRQVIMGDVLDCPPGSQLQIIRAVISATPVVCSPTAYNFSLVRAV